MWHLCALARSPTCAFCSCPWHQAFAWSIEGRWRADGELQTRRSSSSKPLGRTTDPDGIGEFPGSLKRAGVGLLPPQVAIRSGLQQGGGPGFFSSHLSAALPCNLYGWTYLRDVAWAGTEFPHARLYVIGRPEPQVECEDGRVEGTGLGRRIEWESSYLSRIQTQRLLLWLLLLLLLLLLAGSPLPIDGLLPLRRDLKVEPGKRLWGTIVSFPSIQSGTGTGTGTGSGGVTERQGLRLISRRPPPGKTNIACSNIYLCWKTARTSPLHPIRTASALARWSTPPKTRLVQQSAVSVHR